MKTLIFVLSLSVLVGCGGKNLGSEPRGVIGGGADTGGGEFRDWDYGTAWFPGKRLMRYCWVAADGFGMPPEKISEELDNAFNQWRDYLKKKDLQKISLPFGEDFVLYINHAPMKSCDGTEDLKFYLGANDSDTDAAKKHYTNPVAFTHRSAYDPKVGWGKGFIWLAPRASVDIGSALPYPDWTKVEVLRLILLHEIGHTLGVGHVSGTIMDERIANFAFAGTEQRYLQIDWSQELTLCMTDNCNQDYSGRISEFEKIMGRAPVGKPRGTVHLGSKQTLSLLVADEREQREFALNAGKPSYFGGASSVFQVYRLVQDGFALVGTTSFGEHRFGRLETATGASLQLSIQRNTVMLGAPLRIEYVAGQDGPVIFETFGPGID